VTGRRPPASAIPVAGSGLRSGTMRCRCLDSAIARMGHHMDVPDFLTRCFRTVPVVAVAAMTLVSCATLQMPREIPEVAPQELRRAAVDGIEVDVKAIESEDEYWQLFEEYLPRIGMVAVWAEVRNSGDAPIRLNRSAWSLQIGGRTSAAMSADQVFERYYEGLQVRMYSVEADRKARLRMEHTAWQPGRLAPASRQTGYLFFRIDPEMAPGWARQAILQLRNIRLGSGAKTTLKIVLAHANP